MRINAKLCFKLACGVSYEDMGKLGFSFSDRMEILHNKLKMEGFDV